MQIKKHGVSCFFNAHWKKAKYVQTKFNIPGGLVLAQMALEGRWGTSKLAGYNNHLGIKFEGKYARFKTIKHCLDVYGRTLSGLCYSKLEPKTLPGWLYALEKCYYFESKKYKRKVKLIMKKYKLPLWL